MQEKLELLNIGLLGDKEKLKSIDRWLKVMNWSNGWHYDLDIIWILRQIDELGLPQGSTIIDAGAGLGITQFILAERGYNVLSLDFADRKIPVFAKKIFNIEVVNRSLGEFRHEYMEFINYGRKNRQPANLHRFIGILKKVFDLQRFGLNAYLLRHYFKQIFNLAYACEILRDHRRFGKITFLRGTFNNIPLADNFADALISISAFEHNTYEDMPASIAEFRRVVKNNSPLIITTSASEKQDWYFKPPMAWNFSQETLASWFGIPEGNIIFNYREVFSGIVNSSLLRKRIPLSYKLSKDNGLPYAKLEDAQYIPVGIVKIKKAVT